MPVPIVRFLEEFARSSGDAAPAPIWDASDDSSPGAGRGVPFADIQDSGVPLQTLYDDCDAAGADDSERALQAAREEGYRAAREELEAGHREAIARIEAQLRQEADLARQTEIASLSRALGELIGQQDAWFDRLFEAVLRPVIADAFAASALDAFKARLLEAVDARGAAVTLAGPARLVEEMEKLLAPHGFDIRRGGDGEGELYAKFDGGAIRTRLGRIDELLAGAGRTRSENRGD